MSAETLIAARQAVIAARHDDFVRAMPAGAGVALSSDVLRARAIAELAAMAPDVGVPEAFDDRYVEIG